MDKSNQEKPPEEFLVELIPTTSNSKSIQIEIEQEKTLNINSILTAVETEQLIQLIQENK